MRSTRTGLLAAAVAVIGVAPMAGGQGIGARIRQRIDDKVHQRIDALSDSATDAALARGESAVKCLVTDKKCIAKVTGAGRQVVFADEKGAPLPDQAKAAAQAGVSPTAVASTTAGAPVLGRAASRSLGRNGAAMSPPSTTTQAGSHGR